MAKRLFPDGTEVVPFYVRAIRNGPFVFVSGTSAGGAAAQGWAAIALTPSGRCELFSYSGTTWSQQ